MPRGPRLDIEGALHHVMVRGIARENIFLSDKDREDLLIRFSVVMAATQARIYAWCLMRNHFHLLLRTGSVHLSTVMRKILTGYAVSFNRRHKRSGHLFQNRYKSILVEEDPYLLELVRYIHLNPIRAHAVHTMTELALYPWSGHATLLGNSVHPWQETDYVLQYFGSVVAEARSAYETFVAGGIEKGKRPDLAGGGLLRSAGGVQALIRGREGWASDERILGSSRFVVSVAEELDRKAQQGKIDVDVLWQTIVTKTAEIFSLTPAQIGSGGRQAEIVKARFVVSYVVAGLGVGLAETARRLNTSKQSVLRGIEKGPELLRQLGVPMEAFIDEAN